MKPIKFAKAEDLFLDISPRELHMIRAAVSQHAAKIKEAWDEALWSSGAPPCNEGWR